MSDVDPHSTGAEATADLDPAVRAALERDAAATPSAAALRGLLDGTLGQVEAERGPLAWLRGQATWMRRVLMLAVAVGVPLAVLSTTPRIDLSVFPGLRFLLDLALFIVPAAVLMVLALRPVHRAELGRWVEPAAGLLGIATVVAVAMLPQAHHAHPESLLGVGDDLIPRAVKCFIFGSACAIPVLVWVRVLSRRTHDWLLPTVAAGLFAGVLGVLSVYLHCPLTSPVHLALGHATVLIPFAVLVLVARRRVG